MLTLKMDIMTAAVIGGSVALFIICGVVIACVYRKVYYAQKPVEVSGFGIEYEASAVELKQED